MHISHPKIEGKFQASKWLSHRALLDSGEMAALLSSLPPFKIYNVSEVVDFEESRISVDDFLIKYIDYVTSLKAGLIPDITSYKPYFSAAFSVDPEALYAMEVKEGKYIMRIKKPVIQLSLHHFTFSLEENSFHSMVHSKSAISWGLQFAYPQLYSNSIDNDVIEAFKDSTYPNTVLFKTLAKWMRAHTTPTPFIVDGKSINATFRLGKKSQKWINIHPQLKGAHLSL